MLHGRCCRGPLQVQRQQPLQDLLVGQVVRPAVGVEHGAVELLVGQIEPGWALVVQVGERALLQLGLGRVLRVEPAVALLDQFAGGLSDGFDARVAGRFAARQPGEGEGLGR